MDADGGRNGRPGRAAVALIADSSREKRDASAVEFQFVQHGKPEQNRHSGGLQLLQGNHFNTEPGLADWVAIGNELADMGATPQEIASTFAVMAAMLAEACGGTAEARRLAQWTRKITAREARAVIARNASTA